MKGIIVAMFCCLSVGAAFACPSEALESSSAYRVEVDQILNGAVFEVVAGGPHYAADCDSLLILGDVTSGYYAASADFLFEITRLEGHRLFFEVDGRCDTMLMLSFNGHTYHDDDDAGDLRPRITLTQPRSGRYFVWVGTYEPEYCDARLMLWAERP